MNSGSLALPFPIRGGGYMAQVIVPRDMTREEATRLCEFVMSLAVPWSNAEAPDQDASSRAVHIIPEPLAHGDGE